MTLHRRNFIGGLGASALSAIPIVTLAQNPPSKAVVAKTKPGMKPVQRLAAKLRIVIPANPGGGWDQTGRALGASLVASGVVGDVEYENVGGKGGTIGLAHYAGKYESDVNTVIVGGTVMVGAVALQKPAVDMSHLKPIARLTSDYLLVVVAANSPINSATDLAARLRQGVKNVPFAGGSAGGVDHMFSGVFARAAGGKPEELAYLPFASGAEVVSAVTSGRAVVGVSGYSEFSEQLAGGKLKAIGLSSKRTLNGIPAIRDQGVDVDMANWRGVFTGSAVPKERIAEMLEGIRVATQHESWTKILKQNRWESSWLAGSAFESFIDFDATTAQVMVHLLKLKA